MKKIKILLFFCILTFAISCGQQKKYIQYKVKQGETMSTIAKNLDMKTKDLLRLNPDIGRRPDANTVIIIPGNKTLSKTNTENKTVIEDDKENLKLDEGIKTAQVELEELRKQFVIHEVKPKETIYGLKRFYNVSAEELLVLNPELSDGLKIGQFIKIKPIVDGSAIENLRYEDVIKEDASLKVALLLPFMSFRFDSIASKDVFQKSRLANITTDFYLGAELAIDSLRKQGIDIELNIFDTEKKNSKIRTIISKNDLNVNDVIIGPLYSDEVEIVAKKVSIPVVFPVYSDNQSKFSSSNIINTAPEKQVFRDELTTYIKDSFTKGTLIIVGDEKSNSDIFNIKQELETNDSISNVYVLKPKDGYINKNRFLNILKPNTNNWVVIATNNNVVVADAINSLISLPEFTSVKVFTFDKGNAFNVIDNFKLAKIGLTYVSDQYVDESSYSTKIFNKQYFEKNNALPSFYATKGFDITYDVLIRLASGNKLKATFNEGASFRVESKFDYNKKLFKTSENNGLFIVQYNEDLTLTRLK